MSTRPPAPSRRAEFLAGTRATVPLVVGGIPFGVIFGAIASTAVSPEGAAAMSAFVYAGSAQFIGATLFEGGATGAVIILTTFVVNLRHALYAASLAPYMGRLPQRWLLPLGFTLTDETFVVAIRRYEDADASPHKHWFYAGSALFMYASWQVCTWVGIAAGQVIPAGWGLDFAMVVTFIGMIVPLVRSRPVAVAVLVAGGAAVLAYPLPNQLGLLVASLAGVVGGVAAQIALGDPPAARPDVLAETRHEA